MSEISRAEELFFAALEKPSEAERSAFLEVACAGDPSLLAQVERLLAAHFRAEQLLKDEGTATLATESSAGTRFDPSATASSPSDGPPPTTYKSETATEAGEPASSGKARFSRESALGQVIAGRYTLSAILGEGGMGTVYRAEQTQPVKRQVALKLIRVGMDSRLVLARFEAERQALAMMDHPNIARVFDGGATETNQPFFVMELVQGIPITEYCDQHRLPLRARLELFAQVCQAVQHAHQKGIIHRDLKPSNVMVTEVDGRPTPKVIDFGVAKATEFSLTDQSLNDTGAIVGTPTYMSPEQADPSSMDIDTRTDIYALGVILYELLAGSPPIDPLRFRHGAILEMLRMVREVDPHRPSTKVSTSDALPSIAAVRGVEPAQLKRSLSGDLDWIVMKALEKDRTRRYETANSFGADVLRHLANEPVQAAPPSRVYRLTKFVRKHRTGVIAATLVLLALVGGIVGTSIGFYQANLARKAETKRAEAEAKERLRAETAEAETGKKAEELADRLDTSTFLLASAAYDNRNAPLAIDRLNRIQPRNRGWEWRYLRRQSIGGIFTLYGHTGAVTSVAFSPDGSRIVTGSKDETAKVWDARTGTPQLELRGHTGGVNSVAFSPDGSRIVTGSHDNTAKVWDARTGSPLIDLKGHKNSLTSVAYSPDGSQIVTGSQDRTAKVWDSRTGTPLIELEGHTAFVNGVAFSPVGSQIVTASDDTTTKVWDARTGKLQLEIFGDKGWVDSVAFSPDGSRIVTGCGDASAKVWDARTGMPLRELKGHTSPVSTVAFSPDGSRIVTGSHDQTANVWDSRTGSLRLELKGHTDSVRSAAFSPDASRIVTGSDDGTAKVWDARTDTPLLELKTHTDSVRSIAFSPDGSRIVTGSDDQTVKVWDTRTGTPLLELKGHTAPVASLAFSADGSRILTGSWDDTAKVWDARSGTPLLELKGHKDGVNSVALSPDGSRIVTGSDDDTAMVWDARTGTPQLELQGHANGVNSAAFSPDGSRIVTGSHDKTAKVWDARTGTHLIELKGHTSWVASVAFSPDGSRILTGSWDNTAKLWDARTGTLLIELKGHTFPVWSAAFSPDGSRIVTGSGDHTVKLWDTRTGTPLLELKGHSDSVTIVAFSPDGSRIVSGSLDRTAKVWAPRIGTPLIELMGHTGTVNSAAFSPDGSRVVTASDDTTAKVWDARTGTPQLELKGHTDIVNTAAFSPDGSRIVTGSDDTTAKVWDARTGTPQLELKGHTASVLSVAFSSDGSRIVTEIVGRTTKVWDAHTGQELADVAVPQTLKPSAISSDGRWIAHASGNRVEIVPLQPDEEELAYRRFWMQPSFRLYRENYEAAKQAQDDFATSFYFNLLPAPEQNRIQAEKIVGALFARLVLREDVLAELHAHPAADPEVQRACINLAETTQEDADQCNAAAWALVRDPGKPEANYQRGLRLAQAACRLQPDFGNFLNTLGVAQYRHRLFVDALATLTRSNGLNEGVDPFDLAFLALTQHRLGQTDAAATTLGRLREVMKTSQSKNAPAVLREAELIDLDRAFPADPFQR